jgi:hypothetical protein
VPLTKTSTGLEATVDIPWGHKIKYKFIVDGQWLVLEDQPTEVDPGGYVNNVYIAPPRPIIQHIEGVSTNGKAELAETERADSLSQAAAVTGPGFPQSLSDIASTVRDGTSSALGYMASGLGGVVNSFVGIDPINAGQVCSRNFLCTLLLSVLTDRHFNLEVGPRVRCLSFTLYRRSGCDWSPHFVTGNKSRLHDVTSYASCAYRDCSSERGEQDHYVIFLLKLTRGREPTPLVGRRCARLQSKRTGGYLTCFRFGA